RCAAHYVRCAATSARSPRLPRSALHRSTPPSTRTGPAPKTEARAQRWLGRVWGASKSSRCALCSATCACLAHLCFTGTLGLLSEHRKSAHIANRRLTRQHHHQTVDAEAKPRCGRHAVLERADVVLVVVHRLFCTTLLLIDLFSEARCLIFRIVELAERIAALDAIHEQLEPLRKLGLSIFAPREGRNLSR